MVAKRRQGSMFAEVRLKVSNWLTNHAVLWGQQQVSAKQLASLSHKLTRTAFLTFHDKASGLWEKSDLDLSGEALPSLLLSLRLARLGGSNATKVGRLCAQYLLLLLGGFVLQLHLPWLVITDRHARIHVIVIGSQSHHGDYLGRVQQRRP